MLRLLLLVPTTTYRTADFLAAAQKLDVPSTHFIESFGFAGGAL